MLTLRKHVLVSGLLLGLEAWLGIGIIGAGIGIVVALATLIAACTQKDGRSRLLGVAGVYALLLVATMGILTANWRIAQRRSAPVILAIDRFHSTQGYYPDSLNELVPAYLPSIPGAGFSWLARHFGYAAERPQLYFPAMFHGVVAYDFSSRSWTTNE